MKRKAVVFCMLLAMLCVCAGCKPRVKWKIPYNGKSEVKGDATIKAWFNARIDPATLDMTVVCDGNPVTGTVEITTSATGDTDSVEFEPGSYLKSGEACTVTIAGGLQQFEGPGVMLQDYTWSFSVDSTPPELTSLTESGTISAGNAFPVFMKFNEPIGDVDYSFNTTHATWYFRNRTTVRVGASFMEAGTTYTFRLTGFEDTAGNHVATDRVVVLTAE